MNTKFLLISLTGIVGLVGLFVISIAGIILYMCFVEPSPDKNPEKQLLVNVCKDSIIQIHLNDGPDLYGIWLHANALEEKELCKTKYLGKIDWLTDTGYTGYSTDINRDYQSIRHAEPCPKWWKFGLGYSVYQLEKSDWKHPPHIVCTIFISPDKKDIYIYQYKNTRSN